MVSASGTQNKYRIIVCGGRNYDDRSRVYRLLDGVLRSAESGNKHITIIHGAASGADALAAEWAVERNVDVVEYHADWKKHGRAAGPIRNRQMLTEHQPDAVIAFPGGTGTAHMMKIARKAGVYVLEVK